MVPLNGPSSISNSEINLGFIAIAASLTKSNASPYEHGGFAIHPISQNPVDATLLVPGFAGLYPQYASNTPFGFDPVRR